ncbi:MAG: glycoside hydrolase family 78 protein [Tannerella sp.]|nr:glycoside hydrolase family 78 protein [Tannerella sp.]
MNRKINFSRRAAGMLAVCACLLGACTSSPSVGDLRCEYLSRPAGIDVPHPRFSWSIASEERGVYQMAYRVIVSDNSADVRNRRGNCWDSGMQESDNTIQVAYEGEALRGNRSYFWRVCAVVNGREVWSEPAFFHTGLLGRDGWKAQWIATEEEPAEAGPLLRNTFTVEKRVREAYAFATAAGFYELYLNGQKAGNDRLHPAITDYRKTLLYSVYDVTAMLKKGENALGVMLGNGAYNLLKTDGRYGWDGNVRPGNPCFSMQLKILYEDGSETLVVSDGQWKYAFGPVTFNNIYGGEDYDARREMTGWAEAGFDDAGWRKAAEVPSPGGVLKWQSVPIEVTETLASVTGTRPARGVYLFDLGRNIAGWWRVEAQGTAGQTLRIRGAETLNDALFAKDLEPGDTLSEKFAYHARVWTDYTLKGSERETWEPHFFYTGFRYVEVAVSDGQDLTDLKIEGRVVRSAMDRNGEWTSSSPLLNRIHEAGLWAQKGNTVGYPTDCPHREKGAYTGDGQVIAEAAMHDFEMAPFYYKWLNDMRDAQEPGGRIPNTAPTIIGGMGGGVAWGSAYILIPWWMYHYYDDVRILDEHYAGMRRYMDYLRNLARIDARPEDPYIIDYFDGYWYSLGEWCAPGESDCPNHAVVNTFYYYYNALLMSRIAAALGHPDDAQQYRSLSDTVRQEFNRKFFSAETLLYGTDSTYQTYQLLALVGDLVPEEYREGVLNTVVADIQRRDNHLNTGIIGTKYLWPVLSAGGYHDLAYAVATQETYPGFGYWINNHATTLLERWEGTDSHNHQMFGSVTEYFYRYLAGIRSPLEGKTTNGYRHVFLNPCMPAGLQMAKASLQMLPGRITSGWERQGDGQYSYEVSLPANTSAIVLLPADPSAQVSLTEGGEVVWQDGAFVSGVPGIWDVTLVEQGLCMSLESGDYRFIVSSGIQ